MPQEDAQAQPDGVDPRMIDAARAWDGAKPDPRPPGSDALWYDPAPYRDTPENRLYQTVARRDFYIAMRDGRRLAMTLYLPDDLESGGRLPTLVNVTCYWRGFALEDAIASLITGDPWYVRWLVRRGYAYLMVDARGTGASFGRRAFNFDPAEIEDWTDILDWVAAEPWSNGRIGAEGVSYMGISAYLSLSRRHPALVAVMPKFAFHHLYTDMTHPGGIFGERTVKTWSDYAAKLQRNEAKGTTRYTLELLATGVRRNDEDPGGALCRAAVAEHADNASTYDAVRPVAFCNEPMRSLPKPFDTTPIDDYSPRRYADAVEASGRPIYSIGGWYDGGFLAGTVNRFLRHNGPQDRLIIGPWDHGASQNISPGSASRRPGSSRFFEFFRFFDHHLKGIDTGIEAEPRVHYFTMREEKWKASDTWPPPATAKPLYMTDGHALSADGATTAGSDIYVVDMSATTGHGNRWHTIVYIGNPEREGDDIAYPDRAAQIAKLLSYRSAPLADDTEVTGHPVAVLHVSSNRADGAFHVYIDDIAPDGSVTYVTEGLLRGTHRKISPPPFAMPVPYHSHRREDVLPMPPGEIVTLEIGLLPTSYLFRKGHAVAVSIAGADKDNFERVPPAGDGPTIRLHRGARHPSHIRLPVVARPSRPAGTSP